MMMKEPNFNEEKKLWGKGYEFVIGIDESGRGPLAGPVVAAAVIIRNFQFPILNFQSIFNLQCLKVKDSKKLTSKQREFIFKMLKQYPDIEWGIGRVGERIIDKINILEATKLAMARAVRNLEKKISRARPSPNLGEGRALLLVDGNFKISSLKIPQKSIIKADEKVFSVVCAGIVAKITRDKIMLNYHKKYPEYGFNQHKGYPTKLHKEMLRKHGFCKIHRRTFSY